MRTFISINLEDETKNKILSIQQQVTEEIESINKYFLDSIKWEPKEKFHLTLFFIGEIAEEKLNELHKNLSQLENKLNLNEISFKANGINAFPKLKFPRVIILELNNDDERVFELSFKLNESLKEIGIESDKQFHPHITIGRVRREHKINLSGLKKIYDTDLEFSVRKFYLMKSNLKSSGSEYEVLKEYKLINEY